MAVVPVCEGAAELFVAEVVVPDELGYFGAPEDSLGCVGKGTEADCEFCACAGCEAARCGRCDRRRCEGDLFDAGLLPGGHEAWEVFGICEEGEDAVNRIWEPLFGLKCVAHVELVIACCEGKREGYGLQMEISFV